MAKTKIVSPWLVALKRTLITNRLKGPSIEIVVGTKPQETWCLPKNLISEYSPFLKAACSLDFKEKEENRILLPDEDPLIFSHFVEWMYYDEYTPGTAIDGTPNTVGVRAWVLGDKLMSTAFKNYVTERVYNDYDYKPFGANSNAKVTTGVVAFVCNNTVLGAKIRQFYIDLVVTNFSSPDRVVGSTEEWDSIMMDFDDVRKVLLTAIRSKNQLSLVREKGFYMEKETLSKLKSSERKTLSLIHI